jgi:glycine cleavage system H protein
MHNIPEDLRYAQSHEWLRTESGVGTVGITDHAQAELTDVVFVDLPKVGARVEAGKQACVVESVKAASDIYSPVTGTVVEVNEALASNPALINTDPYGQGWIFKLQLASPDGSDALKSAAEYGAQLG